MPDVLRTGSDEWWEARKGPDWVAQGNDYLVTFWWRDPAGTERTSSIQRVWIYITGVTDHHQQAIPQTLSRIAGSDVWQWQTRLPATWRGSYCFIPSHHEDDFSASVFSHAPEVGALREGWRKLLPQAIADPLNHQSWKGGRGHGVSALAMPYAPPQPGWDHPGCTFIPPIQMEWRSTRLNNTRRVWIYLTGEEVSGDRPLAILLDGQFWAQSMPVWPALAALTRQNHLPAAVYLLIDAIDTPHRSRELPCNADFWLAVQQELLPQVAAVTPFSDRPERTLVAGQSFGGLSAMYAGLNWPERFGCILSQSGSYWWPQRGGASGEILHSLKRAKYTPQGLRIWLEAGRREPTIFNANQALLEQLRPHPLSVFWQPVDGGHDALCWRGGLTAGLMQLWQPLLPADLTTQTR